MMQATITTTVPWITWFWPGHSTFFSSAHDSWMKLDRRSTSSRKGVTKRRADPCSGFAAATSTATGRLEHVGYDGPAWAA